MDRASKGVPTSSWIFRAVRLSISLDSHCVRPQLPSKTPRKRLRPIGSGRSQDPFSSATVRASATAVSRSMVLSASLALPLERSTCCRRWLVVAASSSAPDPRAGAIADHAPLDSLRQVVADHPAGIRLDIAACPQRGPPLSCRVGNLMPPRPPALAPRATGQCDFSLSPSHT